MSAENIKIVLACDENFAPHMASLIASILVNSQDESSFKFYVLDGGITEESKAKIQLLKELKDFEIQFITIDFSVFKDLPDLAHFSKNTYSRLLIPEMMPQESRILYLDCDMIVVGSLSELWNQDMKGKAVACAWEHLNFSPSMVKRNFLIGMESHNIFNAGMLLINLDKIRQLGLFQKVIQWMEEHKDILYCPDQDGLNAVLVNDRLPVSEKWNYAACDTNTSTASPVIIHYLTKDKPWHLQYTGRFQDEYIKYRGMTPWKNFKPEMNAPDNPLHVKYPKGLRGVKCRMADYLAHILLKHSPWIQKLVWLSERAQAVESALQENLKKYTPMFKENADNET